MRTALQERAQELTVPVENLLTPDSVRRLLWSPPGDGSALIIHAKPDDYKTDPSGDSGDRIACSVVAKGM